MASEPDSIILEILRRILASQERTEVDVSELKSRASALEQYQGQVLVLLGTLNSRMDRFDERLGRIERRFDLVDV